VPDERLFPQNQFRVINAFATNTFIHAQTNPSGELEEKALVGPYHLARVLPLGVGGNKDEVGGGHTIEMWRARVVEEAEEGKR